MCQDWGKERGGGNIFCEGISVGYGDDFNGLNGFAVEHLPLGGSVKLLATFVGKVLPLSGSVLHTFHRRAISYGHTQTTSDVHHPFIRPGGFTRDTENSENCSLTSMGGPSTCETSQLVSQVDGPPILPLPPQCSLP